MNTLHPFDELVQRDDPDIRLTEAALLFAQDHCPGMDPGEWLERLDGLGRRVRRMPCKSAEDQVAALRAVLVEEEGFSGNRDDYSDPRNSFLNCVIERRLGIPISLSAIWLDVAGQLGWPFFGVGLPGHFMIKRLDRQGELLVDPFGGGRVLSRGGCKRLLSHLFGHRIGLDDAAFEPMGTKATLMRMLNNLHSIFMKHEAWSQVSCVLVRMLALEPESAFIREQIAQVGVKLAELN